jgi:hypothetical protein
MSSQYICRQCETYCEVLKLSECPESVEFWGTISSKAQTSMVSDCCGADLFDKNEAFEVLGDNHLQMDLFYDFC